MAHLCRPAALPPLLPYGAVALEALGGCRFEEAVIDYWAVLAAELLRPLSSQLPPAASSAGVWLWRP